MTYTRFIICTFALIQVALPSTLGDLYSIVLTCLLPKLSRNNLLLKMTQGLEAMAQVDIVCTPITGIMTHNRRILQLIWNHTDKEVDIHSDHINLDHFVPPEYHHLFTEALAINTEATLDPNFGLRNDIAALQFLRKAGVNINAVIDEANIIKRIRFTPDRKRGSTLFKVEKEGCLRIHQKGAPENVLRSCDFRLNFENRSITPMDAETKLNIETQFERLAEHGLRVIALGFKDIDTEPDHKTKDEDNIYEIEKSGFIFLALVAFKDPLQMGVESAGMNLRDAGVSLRILTGESKNYADALGKKLFLVDTNTNIMDGSEFQELSGGLVCPRCSTADCKCTLSPGRKAGERIAMFQNRAKEAAKNVKILTRAKSEEKATYLVTLREMGQRVAFVGRQTADYRPMKEAYTNLAITMEERNDVVKDTASIWLLDDNLDSVYKSVIWGRHFFTGIRSFLQFQITTIISCIILSCLSSGGFTHTAFHAGQLLWISIVFSPMMAYAYAVMTPDEKSLSQRKPNLSTEKLITISMKRHMIWTICYQAFVLLWLYIYGDDNVPEVEEAEYIVHNPWRPGYIISGRSFFYYILPDYNDQKFGPSRHMTLIFNTFFFLQLFNFYPCTKYNSEINVIKGFLRSKHTLAILTVITIIHIGLVEYGAEWVYLHRYGLTSTQWAISVGFGLGGLLFTFLIRLCGRLISLLKDKFMRNDTESLERMPLQSPHNPTNQDDSSPRIF